MLIEYWSIWLEVSHFMCYPRIIFGSVLDFFIKIFNVCIDKMSSSPLEVIRHWHKVFYGCQAIQKLSSEDLIKVRIRKNLIHNIILYKNPEIILVSNSLVFKFPFLLLTNL